MERLSSFGGKNIATMDCRLVHRKVSFIKRCPLFRVEVPLYICLQNTIHVHVHPCLALYLYRKFGPCQLSCLGG